MLPFYQSVGTNTILNINELWIQMKIANREDSPTTKALTVNRNRAHLISENGLYAR